MSYSLYEHILILLPVICFVKHFSFLCEIVLLRRLIRSLEDRHSVIPGLLIKLRLEGFFQKEHCFLAILIEENPHQTKGFLSGKLYYNIFDCHTVYASVRLQKTLGILGLVVMPVSTLFMVYLAVKIVVACYIAALDLQGAVVDPVFP